MPVRDPSLVLVRANRHEPQDIQRKAIASLGTKDLVDPDKCRKVFQQLEKRARHELGKSSRPFPATNTHFVPWDHVPTLVSRLDNIKADFEAATQALLQAYPGLRAAWQQAHPDVLDAAYPPAGELAGKFRLAWHTFKVAGAGRASAGRFHEEVYGGVEPLDHDLEPRERDRVLAARTTLDILDPLCRPCKGASSRPVRPSEVMSTRTSSRSSRLEHI